ncbi:amino acid ABC transporter permease [Lachnospiraceae bacterium YH-ros2228]|jgi:ABC-type amino acid transport system permease subunit|nr:amino acid ABC transporter permease [Lachnospiraceae bacterium]MDD6448688.1 amino acid ABC transporter permease [Lachnospiraceae bacterium]MDD6451200.1 amino acid ABC transporter permease [Lachnospiraceae bacterium]MDD6578363.1 amino acid ABC transporter permease [Lachnospiraceae bacterium]
MSVKEQFIQAFVKDNRYQLLLSGFGATILITLCAAVIGVVLGFVCGMIRATYDKNQESMKRRGGVSYYLLSVINFIAKIYITVIRGTPTVIQLMISYFLIFAMAQNGVPIAIFAFGLNSGAYVSEIVRGGVMSVDEGQFEAGRSLGFSYVQTLRYIIIPQVTKSVFPALMNEFITLFKETSISGYVGIRDLTKAGDIIRSSTYQAFMPLFLIAAIYLVSVLLMEYVGGKLERRMRRDER